MSVIKDPAPCCRGGRGELKGCGEASPLAPQYQHRGDGSMVLELIRKDDKNIGVVI